MLQWTPPPCWDHEPLCSNAAGEKHLNLKIANFGGKTRMLQSLSAVHLMGDAALHHIPVFAMGEEWATFPLTRCDLPRQWKGWCTSDRNGWESTQAAWPLMGIGTCAVRTGRAMNRNFKTRTFHPGEVYSYSFPWDQPTSWIEFTSFPSISLESGSHWFSQNWTLQAEYGH